MRKMTLLAGVAKCCDFGASGLTGAGASLARAWRLKKPSAPSRLDSATPAKPAPISHTNSRRVCPQGKRDCRPRITCCEAGIEAESSCAKSLVDIDELIQVQKYMAE